MDILATPEGKANLKIVEWNKKLRVSPALPNLDKEVEYYHI